MDVNRFLARTLVAALLASAISVSAHAATRRVDATAGSDTGSCGSEVSPCASIQRAVNLSASGDVILVAAGTYTYGASLDPCSGETGVVCIMGKHLTLIGGYATGNWIARDPAANPTVIDGEDFQRGLLVQRASPTSPTASLVLDGFRIVNGRAAGSQQAAEDRRGGGLKAGLLTSLTLRDVVFEGNVAAGANTVVNDGGNGAGGGASVSSTASLPRIEAVFERVEFVDNQAIGATGPERGGHALGGGLFMDHTNLQATDVVFSGNSATAGSSTGDGVHGELTADALGGGMAILSDADVEITRFSAFDNVATGGGSNDRGGVGGGGGFYAEHSVVELRDGELHDNSTTGGAAPRGGFASGGGVTAFASTLVLERVVLLGNHATGGSGATTLGSVGGGGAYLNRSGEPGVTVTVRNSLVAENRIDLGTGGGASVGGGGAGLFLLGNVATIEHTTFARNVLGHDTLGGQAFSVVPHPNGDPSSATVRWSIVAEHTSLTNKAAVKVQPNGSASFTGGLFAGNENDTDDGEPGSGSYSGLASVLTEASAGFSSPGAPNHDYHLLGSSPAIDEATGSTVARDLERAFRTAPRDLGAYEHCSALVDDLVLSGESVSGVRNEIACYTIAADSYVVEASGDVLFHAGSVVVLGDGFEIEDGGRFEVVVEIP